MKFRFNWVVFIYFFIQMYTHRGGLSIGNGVDLYSGDDQFESRPRHYPD
jgi:hypothetical protein